MESTNLHHHHHHHELHQDHQLVSSSPSNCYGVSSTIVSPSNIGSIIINPGEPNDFIAPPEANDFFAPPQIPSLSQNLGFQWANSNFTGNFTTQSSHDLHLARIKGEFPDSYLKFTEMLQRPPSNIEELQLQPLLKNEQTDRFLRNYSLGSHINGFQFPGVGEYSCLESRGNFSQILPTINVSNLNQSSNSSGPNALDLNMQALDLFNSRRFVDNHSFYKESFSNYGLDHIQQPIQRPSDSLNKMAPFNSGVSEAKRTSTSLEPKMPSKKSRSESRVSCPPFKVRKEKLGDRVAALQQLVAPFGKTDTASVLLEAIGYIKFLQNQVETLSVPYMKPSRNKSSRTMMRGSLLEEGSEEPKRDLRSRGLCLVPLSCLTYVTDGGGGIWPQSNFSI